MAAKRIHRTPKPSVTKNEGIIKPEPAKDGRVPVEVYPRTFVYCKPDRVEETLKKFAYLSSF